MGRTMFLQSMPHTGWTRAPCFTPISMAVRRSQEPAQQGLQQAEALQQSQSRQHALEQTQQQILQQEQAPKMSIAGPLRSVRSGTQFRDRYSLIISAVTSSG